MLLDGPWLRSGTLPRHRLVCYPLPAVLRAASRFAPHGRVVSAILPGRAAVASVGGRAGGWVAWLSVNYRAGIWT